MVRPRQLAGNGVRVTRTQAVTRREPMQILEIVLYGRKGGKRVLALKPGEVNIITGQSHTGKSALIQIVSYCLGGTTCHVPTGRIVDAVSWFGLLIQSGTELIFVARPNPFPEHSS